MAEIENNNSSASLDNVASHVGGMNVVDSGARSLIENVSNNVSSLSGNIGSITGNVTVVSKINEIIAKVNAMGTVVNNLATAIAKTTKKTVDGTEYGWINALEDINTNTKRYALALHILGRYVNKIIDDKAVPQNDPGYYTYKDGDPTDVTMNLNRIADTNGHFVNSNWQTVSGSGPGAVTISSTITTDINNLQ